MVKERKLTWSQWTSSYHLHELGYLKESGLSLQQQNSTLFHCIIVLLDANLNFSSQCQPQTTSSCRLYMNLCPVVSVQEQNKGCSATTPSGGKKIGCVLEMFFNFSSLQTLFESVVEIVIAKGYQAVLRDQVCI